MTSDNKTYMTGCMSGAFLHQALDDMDEGRIAAAILWVVATFLLVLVVEYWRSAHE